VGSGKRLFGEGTMPVGYKLVDSKVSTTGVLIITYVRAGEIKKGSFALDTPTEAELARRKKMWEEKQTKIMVDDSNERQYAHWLKIGRKRYVTQNYTGCALVTDGRGNWATLASQLSFREDFFSAFHK
jgi:hypothetical protein